MSDVVIRCDASPRIGLGHLTRSIALAEAFREDCGLDATLLMRHDAAALAVAVASGVPVSIVPMAGPESDAAVESALVGAKALVLDYREDLAPSVIAKASESGVVVATIDDTTPRRLLADLAFYPPIPQVAEWDWTGFTGELLSGWEWVVLRRDLGAVRRDGTTARPRVLISLGGSDPHDLSSLVLDAMSRVTAPCDPTLVIGPANLHRTALHARADVMGVHTLESPPDFPTLFHAADIAVISFGVTAYELAACNVPALLLCLSEDHARSASVFEAAGVAKVVGTYPAISIDRMVVHLEEALEAFRAPRSWVHELPPLLDRAGAARVAKRIASTLSQP